MTPTLPLALSLMLCIYAGVLAVAAIDRALAQRSGEARIVVVAESDCAWRECPVPRRKPK